MNFRLKMGWIQPLNSHSPCSTNKRSNQKKQSAQSLSIVGNQSPPTDSKCSSAQFPILSFYNICSIIPQANLTRRLYLFILKNGCFQSGYLGYVKGRWGNRLRQERLVKGGQQASTCWDARALCSQGKFAIVDQKRQSSERSALLLVPACYKTHISLQPTHSLDLNFPGGKGACSHTRQPCWDLCSCSLSTTEAKLTRAKAEEKSVEIQGQLGCSFILSQSTSQRLKKDRSLQRSGAC